jgi:KUP system potassium uptake protein
VESDAAADETGSPPPPIRAPAATSTLGGQTGFHPTARERHHVEERPTGKRLAVLSLTALGIVYGDIGTSPLYALKECFSGNYGLQPTPASVYGLLSLFVWSLILVVSVKYLGYILRADNRGEGGILALLALLLQQERRSDDKRRRKWLVVLGLFGSALLYGNGILTPAISVLGAMEGLEIAAPHLPPFATVAGTVVILLALFAVQRHGTARLGGLFGPVMLLWFLTIGTLGLIEIFREPQILAAVNPWWGVRFFADHGVIGYLVLGSVFLAVTGAEALYADMGHFGKRPIRVAWFALAFPALLLNYFGQGALVLHDPSATANPFYLLAPKILQYPLLVLATAAAIIASQALISGAFSLIRQSVQLGYSPRITIIHTSKHEAGQIYVPEMNKLLRIGCLLIVLVFQKVSALAAAYGIAITGTFAITSILFYVVARQRWGWPLWRIASLTAFFLVLDFAFFGAQIVKIGQGGYVPIVLALAVFILMTTWKRGRMMLNTVLNAGSLPMNLFLDDVKRKKPFRVQGTAVFMTSSAEGVPVVLLHHLKHNKVLHEQVVLMSIVVEEVPEVAPSDRVAVENLGYGFYRITARYGFMETPDVPDILAYARDHGIRARPGDTTFYLGRERIIIADGQAKPGTRRAPEGAEVPRMARWRKKLFVIMARNARSATEFFNIPPNRVVELGAQVEF